MEKYLDPTNDVAFKRVFSDAEILKDFLNGILQLEEGYKITDVTYIKNEEVPDLGQGKRSIFDIKVTDQMGKKYIVEMQNRVSQKFLHRVQFYAAHAYVTQAKVGDKLEDTTELMPIVVVSVLKGKIFPDDVPCISHHINMETTTQTCYLPALKYTFVELGKFHKLDTKLKNVADFWLYFLSASQGDKNPPVSIKDNQVLRAYNLIASFNWTPEQRDAYVRAQMLLETEKEHVTDSYNNGKIEGRIEGEQIGKLKEKQEIARKMLSMNLDIHVVSNATGLSIAEINEVMSIIKKQT